MARIINTATSTPDDIPTQWERDQIYNGLDCCVTREVWDAEVPQFDATTAATYAFSKALQAPAIEMKCRGVLIDQARKTEVLDEFYDKLDQLERQLERIVLEGVGMAGFNWRSNPDLQTLFYERLQIPVITKQGRPTVDAAARRKLASYTVAKTIVAHLDKLAELGKKISVLKTAIDPDDRMRTSYNIAGTNTGRFSSSYSDFGTGGNLQNIEESLRSIFIADKGMKWCKVDARQIQSRIVGAIQWKLFKDGTYLDACESIDLHTFVAKLVWPNLPWNNESKHDKEIAETLFYRHFTRRDLTKKLGHGTNFGGMPITLSEQTGVPIELIRAFQPLYRQAFPGHDQWHDWVSAQLTSVGYIIGITGRKRWFFGRRTDPDVLREAIAYDPQNSEAFIVNSAMLHIWRERTADIMMHEHDGLVYQYPEHLEDIIVPKLLQQLEIPIDIHHGRTLIVPYEAKIGWNRGKYDARTNPNGLRDYVEGDQNRRRVPEAGLLDRRVRRVHR